MDFSKLAGDGVTTDTGLSTFEADFSSFFSGPGVALLDAVSDDAALLFSLNVVSPPFPSESTFAGVSEVLTAPPIERETVLAGPVEVTVGLGAPPMFNDTVF